MHFLPDIYVPCEVCHGARYNRDTLEVTFRGKTIADVLDLSCEEALAFFSAQPPIARHLQTLVDVGLGYIRLGQSAPTLSGGEAQRVKLASELSRRSTGTTLYVLDEPTTGLHFDDVRKLLDVLNRLVDQGNTVIVIEHNLDVVKSADWIVDMGPEGGDRGGTVVAEGTPEDVAAVAASYTGQVLIPLLGQADGSKPVTAPARKKSTRKKYFPIVPEGTMLFSFLLRIPITFTTYLVPVATTGRETSSSSSSKFVSDELSSFFNHILDLLSSAVKKFEEVLSEQRRYSDDAINDDTK